MAINAYTGLMGSGKSYEVVENVILPALLAGRRVTTNVANLQTDEISAYLCEKFKVDLSTLGTINQVTNDDVAKPEFFPVETVEGDIAPVSMVLPGDLVVIDECWRWWATGSKITPAHMTFFRMHRHFVNPATSACCDLVLVVQDIGDLDRKLKVVVENTYRMAKHKSLGLTSRYRVDLYSNYRVVKNPVRSFQRQYNKEIFKLYQSYSQAGAAGKSGVEVAIDGRANIFKGARLLLIVPFLVLVLVVAVWQVVKFFKPPVKPPVDKAASVDASKFAMVDGKPVGPVIQPYTGHAIPAGASSALGAAAQSSASVPAPASLSESPWRVTGFYRVNANHYVVLARDGAVRTLLNPRGFYYDSLRASGLLDGLTLANYTGARESSMLETSK